MNKFWTGEHDEPCRTHFVLAESTVILDRITSSDPSVTDYVLEEAAKCRTVGVTFSKRLSLNPVWDRLNA